MHALDRLLGDRANNGRMRMSEKQRARAQAIVDVLVAAGIPEAPAGAMAENKLRIVGQGIAAQGAAGQHAFR